MMKRMVGLLAVALGGALSAAQPATADCTCRYNGSSYEYGAVVCLRMPDGFRLARCGLVQNNTFWDFLEDACPQAKLTPSRARVERGQTASRIVAN